MKRFFTLSFLFFSFAMFGQNLIPDGSVEDFVECPSSLGNIGIYTSSWQSFRGSPDYWHSCSTNEGLGWDNSLGFQEPKTGEGYLGLFTFRRNPLNSREYIGVTLTETLTVGQEYVLSFHVSRAHQFNAFNLASNNIGALLMTENFLNSEELGPTPGYANFNEMEVVEDTINWVNFTYQFIADSAYQYLAFGNFFDDALTDTLRIGGEPDGNVTSYYYFDDFCLTQNPNGCDFLNTADMRFEPNLKVWPNPCRDYVMLESSSPIQSYSVYSVQGKRLLGEDVYADQTAQLNLGLDPGMYVMVVQTNKGITKKRFVVSN
ncbi:MAG TPA: T9SS type A sorting domain-containing protein [Cryomorphaceae bacterium]|nr:T9SS type A sorting domain-containing protein [Cryomorphaceae bacterium]